TDKQSSLDTWFGVVAPRLGLAGLMEHVVTYPLETFVALLPWSLVLPALVLPGIRRGLLERRDHLAFVIVALVVTYPTVWLAAGALPRYYMPLYPCVAILVGALLENLATASPMSSKRRLWRGFLAVTASLAGLFGGLAGLVWLLEHESLVALRQSPPLTALLLITASLAVGAALRARSKSEPRAARVALFTLAILFALVDSTLRTSLLASRRQDLTPLVAAVRAAVPEPDRLVSLSPVDPRFTYHYRHFIQELPWPTELSDLPPDVDYFCFDRRPTDTAESRYAERGMKVWSTPGTLPFAWEEIARVGVGPAVENPPSVAVIVGRVLRTADGSPVPASYYGPKR
ncbi:MAG: hypothetical protein O7A04_07470, partial [Acidobacteria bacterium]|nr:hypothetical protein [Acidobacteriota bacterium]